MAEEPGAATATPPAPAATAAPSPTEVAGQKLVPTSVFGLAHPPSAASKLRDQALELFPKALAGAAAIVVSIGFVAAVGGLMLWTRFRAAGLPADQAIVVVPREDFVVVGAILLVQYVAIGLAGVMLVRFRDRYGNASPPTRRGLADLLLLELLGIGVIVTTSESETTVWRAIVAALFLTLAWWLLRWSVSYSREGPGERVIKREREAIVAAWFAEQARRQLADKQAALDALRKSVVDPAEADLTKAETRLDTAEKLNLDAVKAAGTDVKDSWKPTLERVAAEAVTALCLFNDAKERLEEPRSREQKAEQTLAAVVPIEDKCIAAADKAEQELVKAQSEALDDPADPDTGGGPGWWTEDGGCMRGALRAGALLSAMFAVWVFNDGAWLTTIVLIAAALALACLGVAQATSDTRFFWTGVALFVSGLVFGAAFTLLRTSESPKMQPVGVLLKPTPGSACGKFLSGVYIARTGSKDDDRIHIGLADRESRDRDSYEFVNGRLTSFPNSEVAAYGLGSLVSPYEGSPGFDQTVRSIRADLEDQGGCSR
jgi:hypothetical protein